MSIFRFLNTATLLLVALVDGRTIAQESFDDDDSNAFSCKGKVLGIFYTDINTGCQVFYACVTDGHGLILNVPFACGNDTLFDETMQQCVDARQVTCGQKKIIDDDKQSMNRLEQFRRRRRQVEIDEEEGREIEINVDETTRNKLRDIILTSGTNFSCASKEMGQYYADVQTGCKVFHVCAMGLEGEVLDFRFMCLDGKVFDKDTKTCQDEQKTSCMDQGYKTMKYEEPAMHDESEGEEETEEITDEIIKPKKEKPKPTESSKMKATKPKIDLDYEDEERDASNLKPVVIEVSPGFQVIRSKRQVGDNKGVPCYSYEDMPRTRFTCQGMIAGGYYADPETNCQMYHVCAAGSSPGIMIDFKFLCTNNTVFDQKTRTCMDFDAVNCANSIGFYSVNSDLIPSSAKNVEEPNVPAIKKLPGTSVPLQTILPSSAPRTSKPTQKLLMSSIQPIAQSTKKFPTQPQTQRVTRFPVPATSPFPIIASEPSDLSPALPPQDEQLEFLQGSSLPPLAPFKPSLPSVESSNIPFRPSSTSIRTSNTPVRSSSSPVDRQLPSLTSSGPLQGSPTPFRSSHLPQGESPNPLRHSNPPLETSPAPLRPTKHQTDSSFFRPQPSGSSPLPFRPSAVPSRPFSTSLESSNPPFRSSSPPLRFTDNGNVIDGGFTGLVRPEPTPFEPELPQEIPNGPEIAGFEDISEPFNNEEGLFNTFSPEILLPDVPPTFTATAPPTKVPVKAPTKARNEKHAQKPNNVKSNQQKFISHSGPFERQHEFLLPHQNPLPFAHQFRDEAPVKSIFKKQNVTKHTNKYGSGQSQRPAGELAFDGIPLLPPLLPETFDYPEDFFPMDFGLPEPQKLNPKQANRKFEAPNKSIMQIKDVTYGQNFNPVPAGSEFLEMWINPSPVFMQGIRVMRQANFNTPPLTQHVLPETSFTCRNKMTGGYYADIETDCQMFHVCARGGENEAFDFKFLCTNETVFNQRSQTCEAAGSVDCQSSSQFYPEALSKGKKPNESETTKQKRSEVIEVDEVLPVTSFTCKGKPTMGYFADIETQCRTFHVCTRSNLGEVFDFHFRCAKNTAFDQRSRICEDVEEVQCKNIQPESELEEEFIEVPKNAE